MMANTRLLQMRRSCIGAAFSTRYENHVRLVGWLKDIILFPTEHVQACAAVFGDLTVVAHPRAPADRRLGEPLRLQVLDESGRIVQGRGGTSHVNLRKQSGHMRALRARSPFLRHGSDRLSLGTLSWPLANTKRRPSMIFTTWRKPSGLSTLPS